MQNMANMQRHSLKSTQHMIQGIKTTDWGIVIYGFKSKDYRPYLKNHSLSWHKTWRTCRDTVWTQRNIWSRELKPQIEVSQSMVSKAKAIGHTLKTTVWVDAKHGEQGLQCCKTWLASVLLGCKMLDTYLTALSLNSDMSPTFKSCFAALQTVVSIKTHSLRQSKMWPSSKCQVLR